MFDGCSARRSHQKHIVSRYRQPRSASCFAKNTLTSIAYHGIAELFSSNKRNATPRAALVIHLFDYDADFAA